MSFVIAGLDPTPFRPLFGADDATLRAAGARRQVADSKPGFPCRVTLRDAEPGESLILVHYEHLAVDTPFRASHAIFVAEDAREPARYVDVVPDVLTARLLSVRAFDHAGMMHRADVTDGTLLAPLLDEWLADAVVDFVDLHSARPGCFVARARRG